MLVAIALECGVVLVSTKLDINCPRFIGGDDGGRFDGFDQAGLSETKIRMLVLKVWLYLSPCGIAFGGGRTGDASGGVFGYEHNGQPGGVRVIAKMDVGGVLGDGFE